jgi:hypothetical protein
MARKHDNQFSIRTSNTLIKRPPREIVLSIFYDADIELTGMLEGPIPTLIVNNKNLEVLKGLAENSLEAGLYPALFVSGSDYD